MLQLLNHHTAAGTRCEECCSTLLCSGTFTVPSLRGLTSPLRRVAHCDLYFNHKYAHPAPPARNTLFHKTKSSGLYALQTDLGELPPPSGQQKWSQWAAPGVPILLFARHNLCNSIFSQCPTEKIGGGKKGGQGPSWPFISRGICQNFHSKGRLMPARHTIQSEGM